MSSPITLDYRVEKKQKRTPKKRSDWDVEIVAGESPTYPVTPVRPWSTPEYLHYQQVTELRTAGRVYRLQPDVVLAVRQSSGEWIAILRKKGVAAMQWIQHGANEKEAIEALERKVDEEFQRLHRTHAMQRDDANEEIWQSLQVVIDVAEYRSRLTAIHEIKAKVFSVEANGDVHLEWFGGKQVDRIPREVQAGNWSRASIGNWYVFALDKVISTGEVKHAMLLRDAKPPTIVSDQELEKRYGRRSASELPSADDHPF